MMGLLHANRHVPEFVICQEPHTHTFMYDPKSTIENASFNAIFTSSAFQHCCKNYPKKKKIQSRSSLYCLWFHQMYYFPNDIRFVNLHQPWHTFHGHFHTKMKHPHSCTTSTTRPGYNYCCSANVVPIHMTHQPFVSMSWLQNHFPKTSFHQHCNDECVIILHEKNRQVQAWYSRKKWFSTKIALGVQGPHQPPGGVKGQGLLWGSGGSAPEALEFLKNLLYFEASCGSIYKKSWGKKNHHYFWL